MGIIRLLLALSVVVAHATPIFGFALVGGQIAVQAFYMISGFYMTLILTEKYVGKSGSYRLFITNRFLRLYPIFWAVLILTLCFDGIMMLASHGNNLVGPLGTWVGYLKGYGAHAISLPSWLVLIGTNILLFGQDVMMFLGINPATGHLFFTSNFALTDPRVHGFLLVPQAWTIGLELMFYLIAPFIVRRKTWIIASIVLISFAARFYFYSQGLDHDPWTYRFFPFELAFFLLGSLACRAYAALKDKAFDRRFLWAGYAIVLAMTLAYPRIGVPYKAPIYLGLFLILLPFIFMLSKRNSWDKKIGELSYPVYMVHILVISMLSFVPFVTPYKAEFVAAGSIILAYLLNRFVADPVERIRQARVAKANVTEISGM